MSPSFKLCFKATVWVLRILIAIMIIIVSQPFQRTELENTYFFLKFVFTFPIIIMIQDLYLTPLISPLYFSFPMTEIQVIKINQHVYLIFLMICINRIGIATPKLHGHIYRITWGFPEIFFADVSLVSWTSSLSKWRQ